MTSFLYIYEWMRCMYDGMASYLYFLNSPLGVIRIRVVRLFTDSLR